MYLIKIFIEFIFWAVITLILVFCVYNWLNGGNQQASQGPAPDTTKKQKKKPDEPESTENVQHTSKPQRPIKKRLELGADLHKNRLDVLRQIERLEASLPLLQRETDFWKEFIAMFPKIKENIQLHKERLAEKRPIVVVGETSAGKSSFLNLMLGVPLLPVDHLHATAGIIKIQKSQTLAVVPKDGRPISPNTQITDQMEAAEFVLDTLEDMVTSKHAGANEDEKTDHSEVEIHWPFDNEILETLTRWKFGCKRGQHFADVESNGWIISLYQEEVTLVDTPGYGETQAMKDMLTKYLTKAVGFLYIVNAGNAGGIQADRLKQIIREQNDYCDKHKVDIMDPGRALFFFNKWDQISSQNEYDFGGRARKETRTKETPERSVWNTNIQKLKSIWTEFKPEQAMKFSVKMARGLIGQCIGVDAEQEDIARAKIVSVVEASLKNGLDPTKKWLKCVNSFITSTVSKHIQAAKATKEERDHILQNFRRQKVDVETKRSLKKQIIKRRIADETRAFAAQIECYIRSSKVRQEMDKWGYNDFPCSLVVDSNETIKKETARVVLDRLAWIIKRDMEYETQQFSKCLGDYIETETAEMIQLLKDLDSIIKIAPTKLHIQVSEISVVHGQFIHYDFVAVNWLSFNLLGTGWILGIFVSEIFFALVIVALPFLFLGALLGGSWSPHATILKKTSIEVVQKVNANLLYDAISKKLKSLKEKVDEFFDVEVSRILDSLDEQFKHICTSTEDPASIINRFTRLSGNLGSYLRDCECIL